MTTCPTIRRGLATALAAGLAAALATASPASPAADVRADVRAEAGAAAPVDGRVDGPVPTTATVTADQLGPDSVVAVVTHGRLEQQGADGLARSLEVITPDGVRHPVYTVALEEAPADWFVGDFRIADWRPELHTALLRVSRGPETDRLVSYDVTTGAVKEVLAPRRGSFFALDPDGSGVLMTTFAKQRRPGRVAKVAWDGTRTWLPARAGEGAITSTDGRTLVTESPRREWWVTDLTTGTSRVIDTPGLCAAHRWLDADSVVATCVHARTGTGYEETAIWSQLRRVDLDGSSRRLGIRHRPMRPGFVGPVFNDDDVRVVQGRSWYESYPGCGGAFLTRQTAAGKVRVVKVPTSTDADSLSLVGTRGDRLVLSHKKDECASSRVRSTLTLFDPVAKDETVLTRLDRDETWREVLAATEVRSWIW